MKNYHFIVFAIVILLGGGLLFLSISDSEKLDPEIMVSKNAEFGEATADKVQNSIDHISRDVKWNTPTLEGVPEKPLPLTRSIPIWVKNNQEIDLLDPSSPQIRPPLDNACLLYTSPSPRDATLSRMPSSA